MGMIYIWPPSNPAPMWKFPSLGLGYPPCIPCIVKSTTLPHRVRPKHRQGRWAIFVGLSKDFAKESPASTMPDDQ